MFHLLNATNGFLDTILKPEFLTSIILGAIGFAIICLAKRITRTVRKSNVVMDNDKLYVTLKVVGLIFVVIAFVVLMFASLNG